MGQNIIVSEIFVKLIMNNNTDLFVKSNIEKNIMHKYANGDQKIILIV